MQKVYTGLAAAAALALLVSAGQACSFHNTKVTASLDTPQEGVTMSTYDGTNPPPIVTDVSDTMPATATQCAKGATNCQPANK